MLMRAALYDTLTNQERRALTAWGQCYQAQANYGISRYTACYWLLLRWLVAHDRLGGGGT